MDKLELLKRQDLVERICPSCHSGSFEEAFDQPTESIIGIGDIGYHHRIQICRNCGFVFASPLLPDEKILKYYEKMSNYEHPQYKGKRPPAEIKQIHRYFELINNQFPSGFTGRALDIGCATAYGLSLFKSSGWEVLGLDPSEKCVELSKNDYGVRVIKGFFDLDLLINEKPFDLIILCHVFEHLVHPDQVINSLRSILSDKGIVYIEVPNLLKPDAPKCYFGFEHVNFYTPTSLTNIMGANGFVTDSLHSLDNGPEISPYYPVIASTWKKSVNVPQTINNYEEASLVIKRFKDNSISLVLKLQRTIEGILEDTPKGRLALWGAGIHTSQLLSETILGKAEIACIFDSDPKKHGSKLLGHEIEKLSEKPNEVKKRIDAILISSEASEDIIYNQISYLEKYGIKIHRLYQKT